MTADTSVNYNSSSEGVNTATDSEIEVDKIPVELYKIAVGKLKTAGGMKTIEQAIEELKEEARVEYPKTVQKIAEKEEPSIGLVPPTNEETRTHDRGVDRA